METQTIQKRKGSIDETQIKSYKRELKRCMSEYGLNDEEITAITDAIQFRVHKEGDTLLRAGEMATKCYSIFKGCVRQYYLVNGDEKTTFFYTEGQGIYPYTSTSTKLLSNYYLSCVEDTIMTEIVIEKELELYQKYPRFESLSRISVEEQAGEYQQMLANYITTTPEERYLKLLKTRPDLLSRIPQYHLASYLGIKPESLSRIRKRIMQK